MVFLAQSLKNGMLINHYQEYFKVVLVSSQTSGNIGAVARAMKNMGFAQLRLVNPQAHHLNRECLDRAMEAQPIVKKAHIFLSLEEAIEDCHQTIGTTRKKRSQPMHIETCRDFAQSLIHQTEQKNIALVFGREDTGLLKEEIQLCDSLIEIPASKDFPSLNLSHAVMITLYELFLAFNVQYKKQPNSKATTEATGQDKEGLYQHLQDALLSINFLDANNPDRIMKDLRNILGRAHLDTRELGILRGICRQIMNKCS